MYLYHVVDLEKYFVMYWSDITFVSFWNLTNKDVCWLYKNYPAHHDLSGRARPIPAVFQTNIL